MIKTDIKECKSCGYTLRKNSNRILIDTHIMIIINNETMVLNTVLCNKCLDNTTNLLKDTINEIEFEVNN